MIYQVFNSLDMTFPSGYFIHKQLIFKWIPWQKIYSYCTLLASTTIKRPKWIDYCNDFMQKQILKAVIIHKVWTLYRIIKGYQIHNIISLNFQRIGHGVQIIWLICYEDFELSHSLSKNRNGFCFHQIFRQTCNSLRVGSPVKMSGKQNTCGKTMFWGHSVRFLSFLQISSLSCCGVNALKHFDITCCVQRPSASE